ncbi:MAG: RIP metalloprotease RseP [Oscillospiraceae bacterium]
MSTVIMIVVALLIFGAVVLVHELGHFIVAKLCRIKVNEFSIGMGPALLKFGKKETQYSLRALPIGGYVAMEGEDDESDDSRSFRKAAIPKRFLVMIAGAFMNFVLGFLVLAIVTASSPAFASTTVGEFIEGASTQQSGLQINDTILRVNGRRTFVLTDVFYEFERTKSSTVSMQVERDGKIVDLPAVVFDIEEVTDPDTGETSRQMKQDFKVYGIKATFGSVLKQAGNQFLSYGRIIYLSLFDLITGNAAINQLSGPVGIVSEIGKAVSYGWRVVLNFLALITINLGIFNLLPLPALDGGKVLLLIVEAIRRKPLNPKLETAITVAGFALLMMLMVFVSFNDIRRLFF